MTSTARKPAPWDASAQWSPGEPIVVVTDGGDSFVIETDLEDSWESYGLTHPGTLA